MRPALHARRAGGGSVREVESGLWRLEIPPGPGKAYRWAQLDDYQELPRSRFPRQAPLRLELRARVSAPDLPGTWGFGLWNDPFSASFGLGGMKARLPALPNAAWFFHAGPPNYLAFRDDHPAQGFLAATFASPNLPALLLAPGALALPLLAVRPLARLLRRAAARLIGESAVNVPGDPTTWRTYRIDWAEREVSFWLDGSLLYQTARAPRGPQGLVLWIDNQYAAFPPSGQVRVGTSPHVESAWLELEGMDITAG